MVIDRARAKAHKAYWLLRYWSLDKYADQCRMVALTVSVSTVLLLAWSLLTGWGEAQTLAMLPDADPQPVRAIVWWVQLIIMVVAAVISYALAPKPEPAKPVEGKTPVVEDGKSLRRIYGTVWVDDSGILAWKNLTPEPIRSSGGKK